MEVHLMTRCSSYYQNIDPKGEPLGTPKRCVREAGHPVGENMFAMHHAGRPGSRIGWRDEAQMVHPMAAELQRKAAGL